MATLQELFDMRNSNDLCNLVVAAGWNMAKDIFTDSSEKAAIKLLRYMI